MHSMAERIEQSTLELENGNLKRELEECKEELGKLKGDQEKLGKELKREISHSDTSQKLNEELSRRIKDLEKYPETTSPLNGENVEKLTQDNSELKSKVSGHKEEIEKLSSQLGTTNEQLELENSELQKQKNEIEAAKTQLNNEHENLVNKFVVLGLDFDKLQEENRELNEQIKTLKKTPNIHPSNTNLDSRELERSFSQGIKADIVGGQTLSGEESNGQRIEKLLIENKTLEGEKKELNSEVESHKRTISELEGKLVALEINLVTSQNKDEQLKKVNKQYLAELNTNNELQMEINGITTEYKAIISNLSSEMAMLKNQIGILQTEKRKSEDFQRSSGEQYKHDLPYGPCSDWSNLPWPNFQYQDPENRPRRPTYDPPYPPTQQDLPPPHVANPPNVPQFRYCGTFRNEPDPSVNLIWYKEIPNLEREIIYMDNSEAIIKLEWVDKNAFFQGSASLGCGEHSGSFVFPTSGEMQSIQTFQLTRGVDTVTLKLKTKL